MNQEMKNIEKIFGKVSQVEASYEVFASAKYYPHFIKVFIPNEPYRKMIPFMEGVTDEIKSENWKSYVIDSAKTSNETHLERSIRRMRTLTSNYLLWNGNANWLGMRVSARQSSRPLAPGAVTDDRTRSIIRKSE